MRGKRKYWGIESIRMYNREKKIQGNKAREFIYRSAA